MTITTCQYFKDGIKVGESPIPDYSTSEIRRAIAKHIGVKQYDTATLTDYKLGEQTSEPRTVNFLTHKYKGEALLTGIDGLDLTTEDMMGAVRKEAEPIL